MAKSERGRSVSNTAHARKKLHEILLGYSFRVSQQAQIKNIKQALTLSIKTLERLLENAE